LRATTRLTPNASVEVVPRYFSENMVGSVALSELGSLVGPGTSTPAVEAWFAGMEQQAPCVPSSEREGAGEAVPESPRLAALPTPCATVYDAPSSRHGGGSRTPTPVPTASPSSASFAVGAPSDPSSLRASSAAQSRRVHRVRTPPCAPASTTPGPLTRSPVPNHSATSPVSTRRSDRSASSGVSSWRCGNGAWVRRRSSTSGGSRADSGVSPDDSASQLERKPCSKRSPSYTKLSDERAKALRDRGRRTDTRPGGVRGVRATATVVEGPFASSHLTRLAEGRNVVMIPPGASVEVFRSDGERVSRHRPLRGNGAHENSAPLSYEEAVYELGRVTLSDGSPAVDKKR